MLRPCYASPGTVGPAQRGVPAPLFVEYFAAEQLSARLTAGESLDAVLGKVASRRKWDEVLLMLAGITSKPVEPVEWLASRVVLAQALRPAFSGSAAPAFGLWLMFLWPTQVSLLVRCWTRDDASARSARPC